MSKFKILLFPFAVIYNIITAIRNYLYNIGKRPSVQFDFKVISVGNLSVGGTGKTPHVEYLIRLLKSEYKIATLSRGYGRKSKGFILADSQSSALSIGDEPFQYYLKFGSEVTVAVGEDRALAIPSILLERKGIQLILLDDAFQHRAVKPSFSILITDFSNPFYEDYLLPYGRLRESRSNVKRADIIIVSKCPDTISNKKMSDIVSGIKKYSNADTPVFFTSIQYESPVRFIGNKELYKKQSVILLTGIANALPIRNYISSEYDLVKHFEYSDHYNYSTSNIMDLVDFYKKCYQDVVVMTTEKDMVKLLNPVFENILKDITVFYIPINVFFIKENEVFNQIIKNIK